MLRRLFRSEDSALARARDRWFDVRHDVETAGADGAWYGCTTAGLTRSLLASLPIQFDEYTFVDYGSGKGKAVLLASRMPFQAVIGVEQSGSLTAIAERNLERFRGPKVRAGSVRFEVCDAVDFPIPDGPLVLYFFNPFPEPVMRRVIEKVRESYDPSPRPMVMVYVNPENRSVIEEWPEARLMQQDKLYAVYSVCPLPHGRGSEPPCVSMRTG